jgi:Protein of unknown function (DUF4038)/Putative collagen-binding domain of a collagenase
MSSRGQACVAILAVVLAQGCDRPSLAPGASSGPPIASPPGGLQLHATIADGKENPEVWWVREPGGCGTVSQDGLWVPPSTSSSGGSCHVVAMAPSGRSTVIEVIAPGGLEIREEPAPAPLGGKRQFTVSPSMSVSWTLAEVERDPPCFRPVFPLRVSANRRYLEDARGRPFRIQADAGWFMSTNASPEEVDTYLAVRQAQGFNAFYLMAMVHSGAYSDIPHAPRNRAGAEPFVKGAFAAPSEPYWRWIDSIVDKAAERGFAVMLAYTYLGYEGGAQGWYQDVLKLSPQACYEWGRWLGNRYKSKSNVLWFALGDYHPPTGSEGSVRVRRILDGIKAGGAAQLFMAEMAGPDTLPSDVPDFADAIDLNSFYGYGPGANGNVYQTADRAWALTPPRPAWQQEGIYERDPYVPAFTGASWETRRARLWSVLAGGVAGDGFGSRDVYKWVGFPANLFSPGAHDGSVAFRLFASLPWWRLRPAGAGPGYAGRDLVVDGGGTKGKADYVTAAVAEGGTHLVAYVPPTGTAARNVTLDLSLMREPLRARWFNPVSGAWQEIAPRLSGSGRRSFDTPGDNGSGHNDWVLVLDTDAAPSADACGSISSSGLYHPPAAPPFGSDCEVVARSRSDRSLVARRILRP